MYTTKLRIESNPDLGNYVLESKVSRQEIYLQLQIMLTEYSVFRNRARLSKATEDMPDNIMDHALMRAPGRSYNLISYLCSGPLPDTWDSDMEVLTAIALADWEDGVHSIMSEVVSHRDRSEYRCKMTHPVYVVFGKFLKWVERQEQRVIRVESPKLIGEGGDGTDDMPY